MKRIKLTRSPAGVRQVQVSFIGSLQSVDAAPAGRSAIFGSRACSPTFPPADHRPPCQRWPRSRAKNWSGHTPTPDSADRPRRRQPSRRCHWSPPVAAVPGAAITRLTAGVAVYGAEITPALPTGQLLVHSTGLGNYWGNREIHQHQE